jgi:5-methylcytosine-specific restriction endonuclease McrA
MSTSQDILKYLDEQAIGHGYDEVKRACKIFLKKKTVSGIKPEKRKPVPREWIIDSYWHLEGICPLCDKPMDLTDKKNPVVPDHIIPIIKGGKTERRNITAAHFRCNSQKGNMDSLEWAKYKQTHKIGD